MKVLLLVFTCSGGIGGLKEAHHSLGMEACRAEKHSFRAGVSPAHHGEAVLPVTTGDSLDGGVWDALGYDQQARVTEGCTGGN